MPFAEAMARVYESVRERLENASRKRKIAFDSKQLDVTFEPDNIVMVYSEEAHRKGESTKFISKWKGPFRIVRAIGPVTFRLVHLFTGNETTAHVNHLRKISPYKPPPTADQFAVPTATDNADLNADPGFLANDPEAVAPATSDDDGQPAYEMESVLGKRTLNGNVQYLIKFRGYDAPEWCWDADIFGRALVEQFEWTEHAKGVETRSRRSREHSTRKKTAATQRKESAVLKSVPPCRSDRLARAATQLSLQAVWIPALW